ncbi:Tad domain-containing protein [Selenomonas sp. AB3002]|uniref:TadE/TadG family type IV pilus assembly protein n=1 Tax=Selenomonas sp. AB3002 TaxID=1392502 RepID=UPI00049736C5
MRRLGNSSQKGAVLVFVAFLLPMLVFFGGMAIDFGRAYLYKSDLQNAADAAALAGVTAASGSGSARLVDTTPSGFLKNGEADKLVVAKNAANVILVKDTGAASANESNTKLRMTKEGNDPEVDADTYYYMVELTDEVKMVFAQLFLPQSLIPNDWNVKVSVKAWAKARINDGKNLNDMTRDAISNEIASNYYEWKKDVGIDDTTAQQLSFTTNIEYDYENGTRREVFNMNNSDSERKDLFINLRQDISAKSAFADNWDLSDFRGKSYDEINAFFYDLSYDKKKERVWLTYPKNDGTLGLNTITLDQFIRNYAEAVDHITNLNDLTGKDFNKYENVGKALEMLTSAVKDVINVNEAYPVRKDLDSKSEVSFVYNTDEINRQDPLFVRIESEEFNSGDNGRTANSASGGVTNSVRDISININADNTGKTDEGYDFRPLVFFYEGPVDADGNRGVGRKSNTVVLNLNADFKGIIYAPNSPVHIKVTGENRKFRGYIIAKSLVDEFGNEIATPADEVTTGNAADFQDFYHNTLNLSEAVYDDFGVVKLNVYKPEKDIFYLTSRASITI